MYKVIVQGKIDPTWSDRLEGMAIREGMLDKNNILTTLEGELSDQAALAGVLSALYEMHLFILSVMCLNIESLNAEIVSSPSS
jgi:hypothetical protein